MERSVQINVDKLVFTDISFRDIKLEEESNEFNIPRFFDFTPDFVSRYALHLPIYNALRSIGLKIRYVDPKALDYLVRALVLYGLNFKNLIAAFEATIPVIKDFRYSLDILYVKDREIKDWDEIVFSFLVFLNEYDELQRLWDRLIEIFYEKLGSKHMLYINIWVEPIEEEKYGVYT